MTNYDILFFILLHIESPLICSSVRPSVCPYVFCLPVFRSRLKTHFFRRCAVFRNTFHSCIVPAQWQCHFGHYNRIVLSVCLSVHLSISSFVPSIVLTQKQKSIKSSRVFHENVSCSKCHFKVKRSKDKVTRLHERQIRNVPCTADREIGIILNCRESRIHCRPSGLLWSCIVSKTI